MGSVSDEGAHQGRGQEEIPLQALILTSVKNGKNCASLSENLLGSCVVIRKHLSSIIKCLRMALGIYSKTDLGGLGPACSTPGLVERDQVPFCDGRC